jgi:hypothetical protein
MAAAKRPARPRSGQKVGKLIEALPFLDEIDVMLLENVPASVVVKFIQAQKGELTNVNPESLANALLARRRQKQETHTWWGVPPPEEEDESELLAKINYRRAPITPTAISRRIYDRVEGGIKDMLELEAHYLAQRDRCDRLLELEAQSGAFGDITTKAMDSACETLWKRIQARAKMNEGKTDGVEVSLSIKNYSQQTVEVLSNPESRHRVMSLLDRLVRFGKSSAPLPLPLPQPVATTEE